MAANLMKREAGVPWFGTDMLTNLRDDMNDLLSRSFGEGEGWMKPNLAPPLNVMETDQAIEVQTDMPGMKPADIDIQVRGSMLTIRGERKEEKEEKGKTFHRVERRHGTFHRTVTLPCPVQEDKIEAQYKDGVVTVTLPKVEGAKTRKIPVK